jgi:alpha-tubulin suppressor-like RCC1 family protein
LTAVATPLTGVTQISASQSHTCAVAGGDVFCWGRGDHGELGLAACSGGGSGDVVSSVACANEDNEFAQQVPGVTNATEVVARMFGTCAVLSTGGVTCWGSVPGSLGSTPTAIAAFGP